MATVAKTKKVNVGTTSTSLLDANPRRIQLILSAPGANRVTLSPDDTAVLDKGITLYSSTLPLTLTIDEHGEMVTREWKAIAATAPQDIGIVEVLQAE